MEHNKENFALLKKILGLSCVVILVSACRPPSVTTSSQSGTESLPGISNEARKTVSSAVAKCGAASLQGIAGTVTSSWDVIKTALIGIGGTEYCIYAWAVPTDQHAFQTCKQAAEAGSQAGKAIVEAGQALGRISEMVSLLSDWWMHDSSLEDRIALSCNVIVPSLVSLGVGRMTQLAAEANELSYILKNNPKNFASAVILAQKNSKSQYLILNTILKNSRTKNQAEQLVERAVKVAPEIAIQNGINIAAKDPNALFPKLKSADDYAKLVAQQASQGSIPLEGIARPGIGGWSAKYGKTQIIEGAGRFEKARPKDWLDVFIETSQPIPEGSIVAAENVPADLVANANLLSSRGLEGVNKELVEFSTAGKTFRRVFIKRSNVIAPTSKVANDVKKATKQLVEKLGEEKANSILHASYFNEGSLVNQLQILQDVLAR